MLAFPEHYASPTDTRIFRDYILTNWERRIPVPFETNWIDGRVFRSLVSPQLYIDPLSPDTVWLVFSAVEGPDRQASACGPMLKPPPTVFVSSMSLAAFRAGGIGACFSAPQRIGYQHNGTTQYDGGWAIQQSSGQTRRIPTSGSISATGLWACGADCGTSPYPACGTAFWARCGNPHDRGFSCIGRAEWMSLDPFVYFDPLNNNRRWMMYVWFGGSDDLYSGNNIAAHPMSSNVLMDASYMGGTMPLAYRFHTYFWPGTDNCAPSNPGCPPPTNSYPPVPPDCSILNGLMNVLGERISGCGSHHGVAEAPSAFNYNGTNYLLYSRNEWDSAAYGVFYRKNNFGENSMESFRQAFIDYTSPEFELVFVRSAQCPGWGELGFSRSLLWTTGPGWTKPPVSHHACERTGVRELLLRVFRTLDRVQGTPFSG